MNNRTERKRIGYAVLGLGIGMAHADAAYASDNADLVAVCDIDEARLHQAEQAYPGVTLYRGFEQLLHDERVDIIMPAKRDARGFCRPVHGGGERCSGREAAGYNTGARGAD